MDTEKRQRLEAAGWHVGNVQEFLGLSDEEAALIEMRVQLAVGLKDRRKKLRLTQAELASRLGLSRSRVAKMELADPAVSLDLLITSLLKLGSTRSEIGRILAK